MEYRLFGRTGLRVSAISLGTVYFGSQIAVDESVRIIHRALDQGINFIDTAEIYMRPQYGAAEAVVGQALAGRRGEIVLATKKRYDPRQFRTGGPRDHGLARQQIVSAIDESLRRLRTDYVDIYYAHQPDPEVPLEETLRAFDDLLRSGKVRYIGLSNHPAWQTVQSLWIADRRGLAPLAGVQVLYNLLDRQIEQDLVPTVQQFNLGLVAYSPLAGGVLTAKYGPRSRPLPPDSRAARVASRPEGRPGHIPVLSERNRDVAQRLAAFAAERGETAGRLAIAWVLRQPAVTSTIMGASTVEQLDANLGAVDLKLSAADLAALAAATTPTA